MPEISVIMGICDGRRYLAEAIESLNAQTFTDWELVLVENGSTEAAGDVAEELCPAHKLILERRTEAIGPGGALQRACELARGRYLAVLDYDDLARPRRLELQREFLEKVPEVGLVGGISEVVDQDGKVLNLEPTLSTHEEIMPMLAYGHVLRHSSIMFRREVLAKTQYRSDLHGAVDLDFLARVSEHTRLACLPILLTGYRIHTTNTTKRAAALVAFNGGLVRLLTRRRRLGLPENYDEWRDLFAELRSKAGKNEGNAHVVCSSLLRKQGYFDLAALHAWHAWRIARDWRAPWLYFLAVTRGLLGSREARKGLLQGWLKVPGHRLLHARGVAEPLQF